MERLGTKKYDVGNHLMQLSHFLVQLKYSLNLELKQNKQKIASSKGINYAYLAKSWNKCLITSVKQNEGEK